MTLVHRFGAGLLAVLLALTLVPVSAQETDYLDIGSLDGVEHAVARLWAFDLEPLTATPAEATPADLLNDLATPLTAFATVIEFDSEAGAQAAYAGLRDIELEDVPAALNMGDPNEAIEYVIEDLDGTGDQAFAMHVNITDEAFTSCVRYAFAQQGAYLFAILAGGPTLESADGGLALLAGLANQAGDHSGPGEFDPAGGSTGGL